MLINKLDYLIKVNYANLNKYIYLIFTLICLISFVYVYFIFGDFKYKIENNISNEVPPQLSDLFPNRENGPHQSFVDEESCLVCHQNSISIPSIGIAPKIKHEFRKNCTSCHLLPGK